MSAKSKSKPKKAAKTKPKVTKAKRAAKAAPPVQKARKEKKEAEQKPATQKTAKPARVELGPTPAAVVAARHVDSLRERKGRGFSFGELSSAGVSLETARRQSLSLDVRRRSVVEGNVQMLKAWLEAPPRKQATG